MILTAITVIDLFLFLIKNCFPSERYRYIKKHVLIFSTLNNHEDDALLSEFASKYLKADVVFVLKVIAKNVNGIVVSELIKQLWDAYHKKHYRVVYDTEGNESENETDKMNIMNERGDENDADNTPRFPLKEQQSNNNNSPRNDTVKMRPSILNKSINSDADIKNSRPIAMV